MPTKQQVLAAVGEGHDYERAAAELGGRLLDAIGHAPTRPHPHAPKRPGPAVTAAAAGGAALDQARDKLGHRPAERRRRAEEEPAGGVPEAEAHGSEEE